MMRGLVCEALSAARLASATSHPVVEHPRRYSSVCQGRPHARPTKGRVLDHIGFDVKDLNAVIKKIEAQGIKLDEPYRKNPLTGSAISYITDPWGTRLELVERGPMPVDKVR